MSIEKKAGSLAVSWFDALESNTEARTRLYTGGGAAVVTIVMWVVHLLHPEIFNFFFQSDDFVKVCLGVVLAPPFVVAFSLGSFVYPQPVEPERTDISGPMSGYFYRERASRRWKLLIASGVIAAANFLLMLVTAGS